MVVIVGSGISGLSTAYYLAKAGVRSTLVERSARLGGVIQTETVNGCVIEAGPDSFLSAKPAALELIRDLDLASDVIGSNDSRRVTYIWKGGRLIPMPDGLMMMVPTKILPVVVSPLLSWSTKIRMGLEYFRAAPAAPLADRSVADFIEDHYGSEAVEYLAEPLLAGVYGGDPRALSVGSVLARFVELENQYGSLTRGVLAERAKAAMNHSSAAPLFRTMKHGLGQMVDAILNAIRNSIQVVRGTAETVESSGSGLRLRVSGDWIEASHLVLACPAYQAGAIAASIEPELGELLSGIDYSSSMTVALGYRRAALNHPLNGFGFLVPKKERRRLVACTWVGSKFSHRVPEDWAVLRCFLGGHETMDLTDQEVLACVQEELRDIRGVAAAPDFHRISRWPRSMAQYTVGHAERVRRIEALAARRANLHLVGNAYYGIGIPDCIRMGKHAAARIATALPAG